MSRSRRDGKQARTDSDAGEEHLRELLQRKLAELNETAIGKSGEIPADQLASVERLSRLVRLADELKAPPSRWPPAVALIIALLIV
ncbi:MAG TPA: hypothetical protein VNH84_10155, partial [Candidatus Saccharimonadales bacterium]|nr:hypothetical protein [Candidatus Saccharimonadales bacterium]